MQSRNLTLKFDRVGFKLLKHNSIDGKILSFRFGEFGLKHSVAERFPLEHTRKAAKVRSFLSNAEYDPDEVILNTINSRRPNLVGRLGGTEARVLGIYSDFVKIQPMFDPVNLLYSSVTLRKRMLQLRDGAGVYPATFKTFLNFSRLYLECLQEVDLLGVWGKSFTSIELDFIPSSNSVVPLVNTAPWVETFNAKRTHIPWSSGLTGKKILIVSSFSNSFESQYARINKVFPKVSFPKFHPIFLQAPLTQGGLMDGKDFFYHLDQLKSKIKNLDFDIALISAGGYSLPLASFAKSINKIGVHTGGDLQLFFGVIGSRWINEPRVKDHINKYWVRPLPEERPNNWLQIERGAYW